MSTRYCTQCDKPIKQNSRFCPQCGSPVQDGYVSEESKTKNRKLETRHHTSITKTVIVGLFAMIIGILFLVVFQFITFEEHRVIAQQPVVSDPEVYTSDPVGMTEIDGVNRDGFFVLSLDDIKNNRFTRAWYDAPTTELPVISYISTKGRVVTAIGITEPCGNSDYTIVHEHIHCGSCNGEWDMNSMKAFGSCPTYNPDPIPSKVDGNKVLIAVNDLNSWNRRW